MATRSELLALAERVEAAGVVDRKLNAEIAAAVRFFPSGVGYIWQGELRANVPEMGRVECCTRLGTGGPHYAAPAYTASLDAAMTLVPERYARDIMLSISPMSVDMGGKDYKAALGGMKNRSNARSFPLALTAASLRARAAMMGE